MGIQDYRMELVGAVPGAERLIMNYEDGGAIEVFSIDGWYVKLRPGAKPAEVKQAFLDTIKE